MSSQEAGASSEGPRKGRRRERAAPVDPKDALEDVLLSAHRIAVSMGEIDAFRESKVSIAEWAILRTVGDRKDVPLKELGTASGLSRQRVRKLLSELRAKNLIAGSKAAGEDKRARTISATPGAARVLASVSQQIQSVFAEFGQEAKQGRKFTMAARAMDRLAKQLRRNAVRGKAKRKKGEASDLDGD